MARKAVKKMNAARAQAAAEETQKAKTNWGAYVRCKDNGHEEYMRRAEMYNRYYVGEQWDKTTLDALRTANRPAHTVNLVLSTVNAVLGEYLSSRQEIIVKPVSGAAAPMTSDLLTRLFDSIQENNKSAWNEAQVVADGLIEERGYFDIRISYDDNVLGEIRETVLDPRDVYLDPGAKEYDPATWGEVIVTRWMTPDEIEALYGREKADRLRSMDRSSLVSDFATDAVQWESDTFAQDENQYLQGEGLTTDDDGYDKVKKVRIIDRQYWMLKECFYFVDPVAGDEREAPAAWDEAKRDEFAKAYGLIIYRRTVRKVRWCVTAADVALFDDWSPYKRFTVVPYFPYFRRGRPFGLITNLVSPQDLLNKTASQELHVVNTSANSGWVFESGTLVNMTAAELAAVGAKTGLVLEYSRGSNAPEKIQPNQIPSGLDRMTDKAGNWFREISGVSDAMLGQPGREISGVALDAKQQRGLVQLEVVFDNLAKTRRMRAEFMLDLIQGFYTEPRLLRLVSRDIDGDEQYEDVYANQYSEATDEILNDLTLGEYKIVVSSSPLRDNRDETTFAQLMQLKEVGVLVPDFAVFEASNLPNKAELVQFAKQMAGMLEPSPEELEKQQMMEEAQLRLLMAQAAEAEAKAQERSANIQLIMAKAQTEGQKIPAEMEQMGAQLRVEMERMALESQMHREDLQTRLMIAQNKNQTAMEASNVSSMVKRLADGSAERKSTQDALLRIADLRSRNRQAENQSAMQVAQMKHDQRMAEKEHALKREEMRSKERVAKESAKAKAKQAKAKPATSRK